MFFNPIKKINILRKEVNLLLTLPAPIQDEEKKLT